MSSGGYCDVDDCTRLGTISLAFPGDHGERVRHRPTKTLLCTYHAQKAQELFASRGVNAPIEITPPASMPLIHSGEQRRYPKRKIEDNTEYDS